MLKNGGVAIEVKKIESPNSALALNSSYPKAKLYSDCEMINRACRFCEPWEVRDMLYVVGVLNGEVLTSLAFVSLKVASGLASIVNPTGFLEKNINFEFLQLKIQNIKQYINQKTT